jgi:OFA family oxalate/formate antiporter-like MFS transporter
MSGSYKTFGKKYIFDDKFLSLIGAVGSMGNGLSRFFWAAMLDRFDFKYLYSSLLIINGILALTVSYAVKVPQIYLLYVLLTYVCYGGHLGMFPAISSQVFGVRNGTQIYGLLFQGFATSNLIQFLLLRTIQVSYGFQPIFWLEVVFSGLAMFLANSVDFNYDWSEKIRENNDRKRLAAR